MVMAANSPSAFKYLHELDKQFSPDFRSATTGDDQLLQSLHFRVGQYNLLLPLDHSTEVINKIDYSPIPISRPWLLGIASRRGQLMTLIDLKNFLFNADSADSLKHKRIIATRVGQMLLGLVVDQVVGMARLWEMQTENSYPASWDDSVVSLLAGLYCKDETYYGLCDFHKFVSDQRFTEMQQSLY